LCVIVEEKAKLLLEALPYIQRFHGKSMVFKIGGEIIDHEKLLKSMLRDIVLLSYVGVKPVIVHGGGKEISRELRKLGKEPKFVEGLRVTDEATIEILHEQLAGKLNKELVSLIASHGGRAVGLSGLDGNLVRARKLVLKTDRNGREVEVDLGFVGEVEEVNATLVEYLLNTGYIPVIAPMGIDSEGHPLNINSDPLAAELAKALRAHKLILITDVPGVLRDVRDAQSLIPHLTVAEARKLLEEKVVKGGMIPKLEACIRAVEGGVPAAHIVSGHIPHVLLLELLTEKGVGTMIERGNGATA
jgi:acetylglutamate kinase